MSGSPETRTAAPDPLVDAIWSGGTGRRCCGPGGAALVPPAARRAAAKKRITVRIRAVTPPRPADSPYSRPFTRGEAERLLEDAGIRHEGVERTYLAPWTAVCDTCSGRGPHAAQGVVARVRTAEGKCVRTVHLFFVFDDARDGWRLVRAAVEVPV